MKTLDIHKLHMDGEGITRDGRRAVIYTVKADCKYPIHGYVSDVCCSPVAWTREGNFLNPPTESGWDLFNKPDANEGKESEAVIVDKIDLNLTFGNGLSKPATTPSESCENAWKDSTHKPEGIFHYSQAMIMYAHGEEVQVDMFGQWMDVDSSVEHVVFRKDRTYRRKPSPATPDKYEMIARMNSERIFYLTEKDDGFEIEENCDQYYSVKLTNRELWKLGAEMMQMANEKLNEDSVKIPIPPLPLSSVKGKN